ncbi:MAG: hypothetical protein H6699_11805, partial [Myxococcales bacterium]|nr:hypothetical protein [Myxococcales bacterium]
TEDRCDAELRHCVWSPLANRCAINGVCYARGDSRPGTPCLVCAPDTNTRAFTPRAAGDECDDGDACTAGDVCDAEAVCGGEALVCNDGNDCTVDRCDSALGCVEDHRPDGVACDDGDACTEADACFGGMCEGAPLGCDDGNDCTADRCDAELGCVSEPLTGAACDDGDACTAGDTCTDGVCGATEPTNCEDGNACTIDLCDPFAGCSYLPNLNPCCTGTVSICDDRDPCTTDLCDPATAECTQEANTAVCDDGDACTVSDRCEDGACGGRPRTCDDGNPCTADACDPDSGCTFEPIDGGACDDGIDCTTGDACVRGRCLPAVNECTCEPHFGRQAVKLTALRIGSGGRPGEALDLDLNPSTCSPPTDCSDGRHNALGVIGSFVNPSLTESVADGSLVLVLDIDDIGLNPFQIAFHQGELDPVDSACTPADGGCRYRVSPATLTRDTCEPVVTLEATRAGTAVSAGGRGTTFPFTLPFGDASVTITLYDVRFQGTVTISGDRVTRLDGVLGGAVPRAELITALSSLPADSLPVDPASLEGLLRALVQEDIDVNGDGTPDAASIGLVVSGVDAVLTGLTTD